MPVLKRTHNQRHSAVAVALASSVALLALVPDVLAQQSADAPLVAPDALEIGLQSAPAAVAQVTAEDVEQLQRDLLATSEGDLNAALGLADNNDEPPRPTGPATSMEETRGDRAVVRPASAGASPASSGQQIVRPIDNNPGVGAVGRAEGGLTSFSSDIPDAPSSPFNTNQMGPATGRGSVFLEPNPSTRYRLAPPVFEDAYLLPRPTRPTETFLRAGVRGGSLNGVDAKDLRLRNRHRPVARGLNCSPPDLRLEEINDPQRPHTYRLTGTIETPTAGYSYATLPTDQRNSFIRPTGGPTLMAMTLAMKAPELGHHQPDGHVHINELVDLSPNALRLDVLVNNIIFRRATQYYCRVPGTLD